jgi:hypothetical protein
MTPSIKRKELITLLSKTLRKDSKFYRDDYEAIVAGVNRKTLKELMESLDRQRSISRASSAEIRVHCQF